MNSFYFKTFARLALLPYIGGTVVHVLRLIYNFPIDEMPFEVDWLVVIIGGYAGIGLIIYAHRIPFQNLFDKIIYGLLIFHLDGSVILHTYMLWAGNHEVLNIFSYGYSFFAVAYFVGFGYYVLRLQKRLYGKQQSFRGMIMDNESKTTVYLTAAACTGYAKIQHWRPAFQIKQTIYGMPCPTEFYSECCAFPIVKGPANEI